MAATTTTGGFNYNNGFDRKDGGVWRKGVCLFGTELCTEPKIVLDYFETPP